MTLLRRALVGLIPSPWVVFGSLIALLIMLPIASIVAFLFAPHSDNWSHLVDTVLPDYVKNSLLLMLGVSLGGGSIGVTTAWLTSMYRFPGRGVFIWAHLLPLAIPAYIIAYTYTGILDVAGPVQSSIRSVFGASYGDYWFPQVRSLTGAIAMFSLVLYPYVYLLARATFIEQSVCVLEASRTLGCNAWQSFFRVALPLARPAVVAGLSLVLMETLADFGTVEYFGVSTFTTGIYRTWFGMNDVTAAAQLSSILLLFVLALIVLERGSRRHAKYHHTSNSYKTLPHIKLSPKRAWLAFVACFMPLLFGFIVPVVQLLIWGVETWRDMLDRRFIDLAANSFLLAGAAALVALIAALLLAYGNRFERSKLVYAFSRFAAMGYAVPGTVVAVGVLIPLGWLDNVLAKWLQQQFGWQTGLLLSGTLFVLLFAYVVRFLSMSLQAVEAGLGKIKPSMDDAARSLGKTKRQTLASVHLPMMRGSLIAAVIIVFVEVLKELPATLVLRPFDFNTPGSSHLRTGL